MKTIASHHFQLFTVYTNEYSNLLKPDKYKNIVVQQLRSFVEKNNIVVKAFVIMHGHIDIILQKNCGDNADVIPNAFLKKITQLIIYDLQKNHPIVLHHQKKYTREIERHFWRYQIEDLVLDAYVYQQKLNYIHAQPVKAGLCEKAEDYRYSSAPSHQLDKVDFN